MNHPFNDGNKRTAFTVIAYLFEQLNMPLTLNGDKLEQLILDIAANRKSKNDLITALR